MDRKIIIKMSMLAELFTSSKQSLLKHKSHLFLIDRKYNQNFIKCSQIIKASLDKREKTKNITLLGFKFQRANENIIKAVIWTNRAKQKPQKPVQVTQDQPPLKEIKIAMRHHGERITKVSKKCWENKI